MADAVNGTLVAEFVSVTPTQSRFTNANWLAVLVHVFDVDAMPVCVPSRDPENTFDEDVPW